MEWNIQFNILAMNEIKIITNIKTCLKVDTLILILKSS